MLTRDQMHASTGAHARIGAVRADMGQPHWGTGEGVGTGEGPLCVIPGCHTAGDILVRELGE